MFDDQSVSAIIVTFQFRAEYLTNLAKIRAQVDVLIVVDNGSGENALLELRIASQQLDFKLIENGANLGIASALNAGIREAQRLGCKWVALFDQDSTITEGFVDAMISDFRIFQKQTKIMQIIPRYVDPATGRERVISKFKDGGVFLTITSGSLFSMDAFEKCGLFTDELFIYCVDDDFSLRIRKHGFYIGSCTNAVLLHQSGHPTCKKFFGVTLTTKNYSPVVRYYYARNKVWMLRTYGKTFPRIVIPTLREFISIPLKVALIEDEPWRKIQMFFRGLLDGIRGRMGPLEKPIGRSKASQPSIGA